METTFPRHFNTRGVFEACNLTILTIQLQCKCTYFNFMKLFTPDITTHVTPTHFEHKKL